VVQSPGTMLCVGFHDIITSHTFAQTARCALDILTATAAIKGVACFTNLAYSHTIRWRGQSGLASGVKVAQWSAQA
jgi:hypothetical protein